MERIRSALQAPSPSRQEWQWLDSPNRPKAVGRSTTRSWEPEPVSYEDSISPEFYEIERKAVFKRAWLNVGRVEQLPRKGSYFTKELKVANTSIIVVRTTAGDGQGLPQHLSAPR